MTTATNPDSIAKVFSDEDLTALLYESALARNPLCLMFSAYETVKKVGTFIDENRQKLNSPMGEGADEFKSVVARFEGALRQAIVDSEAELRRICYMAGKQAGASEQECQEAFDKSIKAVEVAANEQPT